jgi:hypothetical protein
VLLSPLSGDLGGICILFFTFIPINKNCNGKNGRL